MLTEKDYCDNNTCVALKELGLNNVAEARLSISAKVFDLKPEPYIELSPKILLYEAQKWLREEKRICVEVDCCAGGYIYELCKAYKSNSFSGGTTIYTPNDVDNPKLNDAGRYETYEEALSEGVRASIKVLQDEQKENN